jgi:hypothetical protein
MSRKLITAIMTILIALTVSNAHAATYDKKVQKIFVADYRNNVWYAAMLSEDGDSYTPIMLTANDEENQEDMLSAYGTVYTGTFELDESGYNGLVTIHSTEYHKDILFAWRSYANDNDLVEITNVKDNGSFYTGDLNGKEHQFDGIVTDGTAYLLRSANAYSVYGSGWIVQNGMLIRSASTNDDPPMHKVYLPVIN